MIHSKVGEGSRRIAGSCKLHLHKILLFSLYTHCVQTTYNVCSTYKYFKYSSTYKYLAKYLSISTSTLGELRKYLSKVQVLSNLYLSVLKYKYSCTWPHVWSLYGSDNSALFQNSSIRIHSDHIFVMQFLHGNFCNTS